MSLMKWGDRHYAPNGRARLIKHRECGGEIDDGLNCARCGRRLVLRDLYWEWGPGAKRTRARQAA